MNWQNAAPVWLVQVDSDNGATRPLRHGSFTDYGGCLVLYESREATMADIDRIAAMGVYAFPSIASATDLSDNWQAICYSRAARLV